MKSKVNVNPQINYLNQFFPTWGTRDADKGDASFSDLAKGWERVRVNCSKCNCSNLDCSTLFLKMSTAQQKNVICSTEKSMPYVFHVSISSS